MHQPMISRRRFLGMAAGTAMVGVATAGYAHTIEPGWIGMERVDLPIHGLGGRLADRTVALLSDLHLGEYTPVQKLLNAIEMVNSLAPDWVFITGDFICSGSQQAADLIEPLRALQPPAFAVLGNHDRRTVGMSVQESLAETPVVLLHNAGLPLASTLWLAGLDDAWHGRPDLKQALAGAPSGATTLLMVHEPDYFDRVVRTDAPIAAQFSGHTHGGQVRLPRVTPDEQGSMTWAPVLPYLGERYSMGLYKVGERHVYVNRGIGVWPLPYRINCRPEITLFTLRDA